MLASADFSVDIVADDVHAIGALLKDVTVEPMLPAVIPLNKAGARSIRRDTLVFISADSLVEAAPFVSEAARLHRLRSLIVSLDDPAWLPMLMHEANLRTLRKTFAHPPDNTMVRRRILYAHGIGAEKDLIASALVQGNHLRLLTCSLETVEVPFAVHPALAKLSREERPKFDISREGHRIFWTSRRVELDLDTLRYASNPDYRADIDRHLAKLGRNYGAAIRALREEYGLRQTDIDGLSERQVRRIERSGTTSVDALEAFANAHGLQTDRYLNELAVRTAVSDD